jgi:hypothetical protein
VRISRYDQLRGVLLDRADEKLQRVRATPLASFYPRANAYPALEKPFTMTA